MIFVASVIEHTQMRDIRLGAIIAIIVIELISRMLFPYISIDVLTYTLFVRIIEIFLILAIALDESGALPSSFIKELLFGFAVAFLFGSLVFAAEGISKIFMGKGIISNMIGSLHTDNAKFFLITACIIGPFAEELFFRGLFYNWLRQAFPITISVLISALLFASLHGKILAVPLIGGILLALLFEWRKNIWPCFIVHALANIAIWQFAYISSIPPFVWFF